MSEFWVGFCVGTVWDVSFLTGIAAVARLFFRLHRGILL